MDIVDRTFQVVSEKYNDLKQEAERVGLRMKTKYLLAVGSTETSLGL